MPEIISIFFLN